MIEKRINQRFGPLVIKAAFIVEGRKREGYLTNVSVGGAFLAVDDPPPLGTEVDLAALLPWRLGELRARAQVVWRSVAEPSGQGKLTGVGLAFTTLSPKARNLLGAYLARFVELAAQIEESQGE